MLNILDTINRCLYKVLDLKRNPMQTSNYLLICATLTALGAPQIARAQQQPRPPRSAVNLDAKIVLPAQFSAPQFFDALAKAVNTRFVVPMLNESQLTQLNEKFGGRAASFPEIVAQYGEIVGYPFFNSSREVDLIKVNLPDER